MHDAPEEDLPLTYQAVAQIFTQQHITHSTVVAAVP
jgi:hypothetical protein